MHARAEFDGNARQVTALFLMNWKEITMMKFVIISAATLAMMTAVSAADLPHPQPVYQTAQVGKMPIGKAPIGKTPVGKTPVGRRIY